MIAEINIKPTCPHYGICGGCKLYNSTYEEQLQSKQEYINKVMAKTEVLPLPIIPSPILYNYRNKVEFTFFNDEQGNVGLGFHEKGAFNKFVNLEQCLIAPLGAIEILKVIRSWANQHQLTAYNKKTKKGLLRYLIVRKSISNNSFLITLVTSYAGHEASIAELASQLQKICTLTGLLLSVQEDTADAALLNHCEVIFGDDFFMDKIGDSLFKISYNSFFQSNNLTAKILYDLLLQEIREGDKVLDLFCGAAYSSSGSFRLSKEDRYCELPIISSTMSLISFLAKAFKLRLI